MTHAIKTAAGLRIFAAWATDDLDAIDIGDLEDLEVELEEARTYACGLLDRLWALGHELERVRMTVAAGGLDVELLKEATVAARRANEGTLAEGSASAASIAREYGRLIDEVRA